MGAVQAGCVGLVQRKDESTLAGTVGGVGCDWQEAWIQKRLDPDSV